MALTAADLSALKSSLKCWENFEYSATAVVLLGVVGEYIAEFTKWAADRGIEKRLPKGSTLVLIVGIAGEGLGLFRTSQLSGELIASLEEQSNQAFERAIKAEATAKGFEAQIADAKVRARAAEAQVASAKAQAAEAEKAAAEAGLALAKFKEPRTLDSAQQEKIRLKTQTFSGTNFDLYVNADSESQGLMNTLDNVLRKAGWKWLDPGEHIRIGRAGVVAGSGITIELSVDRTSELEPAAKALVAALNAEGIEASRLLKFSSA